MGIRTLLSISAILLLSGCSAGSEEPESMSENSSYMVADSSAPQATSESAPDASPDPQGLPTETANSPEGFASSADRYAPSEDRSFSQELTFEFSADSGWEKTEAPEAFSDSLWHYELANPTGAMSTARVIGTWTDEDIRQSSLDSYLDTMIDSTSATEIVIGDVDQHYTRAVRINEDQNELTIYYIYVLYDDGFLTLTTLVEESNKEMALPAIAFVKSLHRL